MAMTVRAAITKMQGHGEVGIQKSNLKRKQVLVLGLVDSDRSRFGRLCSRLHSAVLRWRSARSEGQHERRSSAGGATQLAAN